MDAETKKKGKGNMKKETIEIKNIGVRTMEVTIAGDGDLVLNKMNDVTTRQLLDKQANKAKSTEVPNEWEAIITSMHWRDGKPTDFSETGLIDALNHNAPCISAFALKKSFGDAVVRNEIDKYKTKFEAGVNVIATGGLVPITFTEHFLDEKLIPAKKGCPVRAVQNRFSGWEASFTLQFMESVYSAEQILNIINLAGFGLGIGSGRSSGFGRYHIVSVA